MGKSCACNQKTKSKGKQALSLLTPPKTKCRINGLHQAQPHAYGEITQPQAYACSINRFRLSCTLFFQRCKNFFKDFSKILCMLLQSALKARPPWGNFSHLWSKSLNFFCLKAHAKKEKWHHFCAHARWWLPWRRKNVEKGHLAPSNLAFLLLAIDTKRFLQNEKRRADLQKLPQIF